MSLNAHLEELQKKHKALDAKIAEETRQPAFDETEVRSLKKQKLRLKDEIERQRTRAA
ncbi:MAG: DUF465 domain-containing protein [Pseudomonadota bacterium]